MQLAVLLPRTTYLPELRQDRRKVLTTPCPFCCPSHKRCRATPHGYPLMHEVFTLLAATPKLNAFSSQLSRVWVSLEHVLAPSDDIVSDSGVDARVSGVWACRPTSLMADNTREAQVGNRVCGTLPVHFQTTPGDICYAVVEKGGIGSVWIHNRPQLAVSCSSLVGAHGLQPMATGHLLRHVGSGYCADCDRVTFGPGICFGHSIHLFKSHVCSALIAADDSNAAISGNTCSAIQGRCGPVVLATDTMSL